MGLTQNALEEAGIATVSITMVPYMTVATMAPRMLYVRFPYGNPFGEPGDATLHRQILESALHWLYQAPGPNLPFRLRVAWRRSKREARPGFGRAHR